MKLKQILLCSLIVMCCAPLGAQTSKEEMFATPEKTGGVYWAYPLDFAPQTKAPKGYKPFLYQSLRTAWFSLSDCRP